MGIGLGSPVDNGLRRQADPRRQRKIGYRREPETSVRRAAQLIDHFELREVSQPWTTIWDDVQLELGGQVPTGDGNGTRVHQRSGQRNGMRDERTRRQRKTIKMIGPTIETNTGVGGGGESEKSHDVGSRLRDRERKPRIQLQVIVVFGKHDSLGRNNLKDRVHG